jgi:hypothetical protein
MPFILRWLIGVMAFQLEALDGTRDGAVQTVAENPVADPIEEDEAHPQTDTQLETTGGGNEHNDDNEV